MRFGRNFYLAALACGLASAIKLSGLFFFLTIPAYLIAGFILRKINLRGTITNGFLFFLVMGLTIILSNPFLFYSGARQRMLEIQAQKSYEISHGYVHEQSPEYQKGPRYWEPTLSRWYGIPLFLFFIAASLLWGAIHGPEQFVNRILFTWFLPFTIYLLFLVSVKPDHYWLPVMLPLFSCVFIIPAEFWTFLQKQKDAKSLQSGWMARVGLVCRSGYPAFRNIYYQSGIRYILVSSLFWNRKKGLVFTG